MNTSELIRLVDSISRDRNVDKESLYTDIEQAMVSAARKHFNAVDTEEFTCTLDRINGTLTIFRGENEITLESLGRIPAQTAKQVMIQRFREDERASIYDEFSDKVGDLINATALRYEGGALVIQVGTRAEGFMPRSEQIPGEQHQPGDRVRCLILDVRDAGNQVKIVLSRASPDFIKRLFEVEVPEVAERVIEIKAMAREAGHRTKIAVSSIDSKVDAVGACVGVRGSRIKNIVDELGGEKIDIVRWNESSQILIQNALKPAEVVEISLCFELGRATVVVNEDQLSLAIGKRGQNVRLAARLTNWDVDILTPAEFSKSLDVMEATLKEIDGIDEVQIDRLAALGVISVFDIEEVGAEYLAEAMESTSELCAQIVQIAAERGKQVAEEQQREKEAAEKRKIAEQRMIAEADAKGGTVIDDLLGGSLLVGSTATPAGDQTAEASEAGPSDEEIGSDAPDASRVDSTVLDDLLGGKALAGDDAADATPDDAEVTDESSSEDTGESVSEPVGEATSEDAGEATSEDAGEATSEDAGEATSEDAGESISEDAGAPENEVASEAGSEDAALEEAASEEADPAKA